jgi:SOS-response transcriptional repressor LexA
MSNPFYTRARLTPRRLEVLRAIQSISDENKGAPSMQELADRMGLKDRQAAHNHVLVLRYNNLVDWKKHQPRTLRITDAGLEAMKVV